MENFIFFFRGGTGEEEWSSWIDELKQKGSFVDGAPLIRDGQIVEENGEKVREFTFDIAENARGYAIIQAQDMKDAIQVSKNCPVFSSGGNITIRPLSEQF